MFFFPKKKPTGTEVVFELHGMHCTSCAMNIDGALEDTPGVIKSQTSYAKGKVVVEFDPQRVSPKQLVDMIAKEGYQVVQS